MRFYRQTNKEYYSKTKDNGTLGIYEVDTDVEIPNNSNPSKKQILLQAVKDLNGEVDSNITLYQLQHKLEKLLYKITHCIEVKAYKCSWTMQC